MAISEKYGKVTVEHEPGNPFGEDEPVFLLRARDILSEPVLNEYLKLSFTFGASEEQQERVKEVIEAFDTWQKEHALLLKVPD